MCVYVIAFVSPISSVPESMRVTHFVTETNVHIWTVLKINKEVAGAAWLGSMFQSCSSCLWGSCLSGVCSAPVATGPLWPVQILKAFWMLGTARAKWGKLIKQDTECDPSSVSKAHRKTPRPFSSGLWFSHHTGVFWTSYLTRVFFTCISFSHTTRGLESTELVLMRP